MGNSWVECELGDVLEFKRGYDLPKNKRLDGSIPVVSSSGTSGFHNESKVIAPGVVTGRYGTIGEVFYQEKDFWPLNTTLYVKDFKGNDPLYIYYFLKTISYRDYTDKAAVPGINRNHIHRAKVRFPSCIDYQKKVACHLKTLDNKITLNRQINQTLEQMAQTLFKSWFVDFDPVIDNALDAGFFDQGKAIPDELQARAEQRQALRHAVDEANAENQPHSSRTNPATGDALASTYKPLPDDIRQLFPNEFEESELGWVPKGWTVTPLNKVAEILNGFAFKSNDYTSSGTFVLRTKNFENGEVVRANDDVLLPETFLESHEKYLCEPFDYHLVMVGASVGKCAMIYPHQLPALRNQNMWCFRGIKGAPVSQPYIKYMLDVIVSKSLGLASGSAREFFRKGDFGNQKVCIGSESIQTQFAQICSNLFMKKAKCSEQNDSLIMLRDTLLPKLISGELRLDEVESTITATTA